MDSVDLLTAQQNEVKVSVEVDLAIAAAQHIAHFTGQSGHPPLVRQRMHGVGVIGPMRAGARAVGIAPITIIVDVETVQFARLTTGEAGVHLHSSTLQRRRTEPHTAVHCRIASGRLHCGQQNGGRRGGRFVVGAIKRRIEIARNTDHTLRHHSGRNRGGVGAVVSAGRQGQSTAHNAVAPEQVDGGREQSAGSGAVRIGRDRTQIALCVAQKA